MFLEWKVPAVRHVKQQAGKEMLAGTKEETVLITRKYNKIFSNFFLEFPINTSSVVSKGLQHKVSGFCMHTAARLLLWC